MRSILLLAVTYAFFSVTAPAQTTTPEPDQPKALVAPHPAFPEEAKNPIYGDVVGVTIVVNKKGIVTDARAYGPLRPCDDPKDPVPAVVNAAALSAAKAMVFEPIVKNGKPVEATLQISYRLRPRVKASVEPNAKLIQGGVLNGKALSLPKPYWPVFAKENRTSGTVSIRVLINEEGRVVSAGPMSGHPEFAEASVDAACEARFSPTKLSGHPVKVSGVITYNFRP